LAARPESEEEDIACACFKRGNAARSLPLPPRRAMCAAALRTAVLLCPLARASAVTLAGRAPAASKCDAPRRRRSGGGLADTTPPPGFGRGAQ
jgi:hypothetical protein